MSERLLAGVLLLGSFLAPGPAPAVPAATIEFLSPRNLSTVVGRTVIELRVSAPNHGWGEGKATLPGDADVVVTLPTDRAIAGRVRYADGAPVANALGCPERPRRFEHPRFSRVRDDESVVVAERAIAVAASSALSVLCNKFCD